VPARAQAALDAQRLEGRTSVLVAAGDRVVGLVAFADRIREDAAAAVTALRRAGVTRQIMLTGDAAGVAAAVGRHVGIDDVRAELSPDEKLAAIRELQHAGEIVAMLGDGVNDAPALVEADVGVAIGAAATPVAVETADLALTTGRLTRVPEALTLSRRTVRVMRQNVVIALITVAALLAGVLAGEVHMAGGMLIHQASVLAVIANAMRLLRGHGPTVAPPAGAVAADEVEPVPSPEEATLTIDQPTPGTTADRRCGPAHVQPRRAGPLAGARSLLRGTVAACTRRRRQPLRHAWRRRRRGGVPRGTAGNAALRHRPGRSQTQPQDLRGSRPAGRRPRLR
jgi:soluble P-type ATPase